MAKHNATCQRDGCENTFYRPPSYVKRGIKKYCSQSCSGKATAAMLKERGHVYRRGPHYGTKWWRQLEAWGLTYEEFAALKEANDSTCEICGKKCEKYDGLARDHDHETGLFRGFLCRSCNTKLGWYEKNKDEIVHYLRVKTR